MQMKLLAVTFLISLTLPSGSFANTCSRELEGKPESIEIDQLKHSDADGNIQVINSKELNDGNGSILTAQSNQLLSGQAFWKPYELSLFQKRYPRILKELNIEFISSNTINYPSPLALNSLLETASTANSSYKTDLRFKIVKGHISELGFIKLWSQKLVPYCIAGDHHYHDMYIHTVGYILLPKNFVNLSTEIASWMIEMYEQNKSTSTSLKDHWLAGLTILGGQVDSLSYQHLNTLSLGNIKDVENYLDIFIMSTQRFLNDSREHLSKQDKEIKTINDFILKLNLLNNEPGAYSKAVIKRAKSKGLAAKAIEKLKSLIH